MRSFAVRAVLLAVVGAAVLVPSAAAREYEFIASDGTKCALDVAHSSDYQADELWTIRGGAGLTCDRGVAGADVYTELVRYGTPGPGWSGPTHYGGGSGFCNPPNPAAPWIPRQCGTWTVRAEFLFRDLPGDEYDQRTTVSIGAPGPSVGGVDPVWVVTPAPQADRYATAGVGACVPGGRVVSCTITESFKPE